MAADTLTISRLRIDCQTVGDAAAERGAARLTEIARGTLGPALAQAFESGLPADWRGSDIILHIPKLETSLDVDVDLAPAVIARAWARALAISTLKRCNLTDNVRFTDRTERLAAFVTDLLHGRAWHLWYWRDFDGLKPLEPSAALRTALLRAPLIGIAALARLKPSDRTRLLDTLTAPDARQVVSAALQAAQPPRGATASDELADVTCRHARQAPPAALASPTHLALSLLAATPTALAPAASLGATDVLDLCQLVLTEAAHPAPPDSPQQDQSPDGTQAEPHARHPASRTNATPHKTPLAAAFARAQSRLKQRATPPPETQSGSSTPFGGAFLIWPHIAALPLAALLSDHTPQETGPAVRALRQAILARVLDTPDRARIPNDPALAHLFRADTEDPPPAQTAPQHDEDCFAAAFDPWFIKEGMTAANWRDVSTATDRCHALKGDAHGYWLRLADSPTLHDLLTPTLLPSDPATDIADAASLLCNGKDRLIAQLAQIACKRMAYRLPGFANSSVDYLRRNFLGMAADVTADDASVTVQLDPAPLGIMLNLTGMSRMRYPLDDGRHVQLQQGES